MERIISIRRGNCNVTNKVTGRQANAATGIRVQALFLPKTRYSVALKAIIMDVMERNKVTKPIINLFGREYRKSPSEYRAVRMDKNINKEAVDEKRERASETANTINAVLVEKIGKPLSLLFPPGTVMEAAKAIVAMRAAATVQEFAVSFIHCSPSLIKSLCSVENSTAGVLLSEFLLSLESGSTYFSTSCMKHFIRIKWLRD